MKISGPFKVEKPPTARNPGSLYWRVTVLTRHISTGYTFQTEEKAEAFARPIREAADAAAASNGHNYMTTGGK